MTGRTRLGVEAPQQAPLMPPPLDGEPYMGFFRGMTGEPVAVGTDRGLQPLDVALLEFGLGVSVQWKSPSLLRGAYIQTIQPLDLGDQEGTGLDQGLAGGMRLFRGGLRPRPYSPF